MASFNSIIVIERQGKQAILYLGTKVLMRIHTTRTSSLMAGIVLADECNLDHLL